MLKRLLFPVLLIVVQQVCGQSVNYVRSWDAKIPFTSTAGMSTRPAGEVLQTTAYADGLGRPLQTVIKEGSLLTHSSTTGDVVTPVVYDVLGRETEKYLPYVSTSTTGNFKTTPLTEQNSFNSGLYSAQGESYYYSKTEVENSPLNRPVKSMAPGNSWVGAGRGTGMQYLNNAANDDVKIWTVSAANNYSISGVYAAGLLSEMHTTDEAGNQVVEYKDKEGKVILKKVQAVASPGESYSGWLCTYYIYDEYHNLRLVLPPKAVAKLNTDSWPATLSTTYYNELLQELVFRYEYDDKNRMSIKKVPGAAEVYMVYDKWDRMVLTQDGNMRINNKWIFTKYDSWNRPVMTGFYEDGTHTGQAGMQSYCDTQMSSVAEYETLNTSTIGYTTTASFPSISSPDMLSISFYDDYNWASNYNSTYATRSNSNDGLFYTAGNTTNYAQTLNQSSKTKGLATGSVLYILDGSGNKLVSSIFYDDRGRAVQTKSSNSTGGIDINTTQYNFSGQPLMSVLEHNKAGTNAQVIRTITKIEYDVLSRMSQVKKQVVQVLGGVTTQTAETVIAKNEYDKLGQLSKKILAPAYNSNAGLEQLNYEYNIRGWLLGVNKDYLSGATSTGYFGMELAYDKTTAATSGTGYAAAQYNGNITGTGWKSKGDGVNRQYDFAYDKLNRLLKGDFKQKNPDNNWNNSLVNYNMKMGDGSDYTTAYDENGNIKRMQQWGLKLTGSAQIDNLIYEYTSLLSNKLLNVTDQYSDAATKLGDFKDGTNGGYLGDPTYPDYVYDVNGNMTVDRNKAIVGAGFIAGPGIIYNHLNLPQSIEVTSKGTIEYVYDAAGNKLKKIVHETSKPDKTTLYVAGAVYEDDVLQFVGQEEGRVRYKTGTTPSLNFDYFIKDHLGNVRMVLTEEAQSDMYPAATMEDAVSATEESFYSNLTSTRIAVPVGYPSNTPSGNAKVAKVSGNVGDQKVGPAIVLKVMAGDKFNLQVNSWYKTNGASPNSPNSPLSDLLAALASGIAGTGGAHGNTSTQITSSGVLTPGATAFLAGQTSGPGKPKAYVNWILFDEQFNYVSSNSGYEQVGANDTYTSHVRNDMPVSKNGFLYIYVSNETPNIPVYFDNLQVTHVRGQILEETHYYPFGLIQAGISSKAAGSIENKKKYNGIEYNNDFDLNIYDAFYRNLDVQIGRWWEIDPKIEEDQENMSPYNAMANDPVLKSDPLGDIAEDGDPVTGAAIGAMVLEGGATAAGLGTMLVAASAVAPIAVVIYHPESLLTGASAAQMDHRVETQLLQEERKLRQNPSLALAPSAALTPNAGGGAATAGGRMLAKGTQNPNTKEALDKGNKAHKDFKEKADKKGWATNPQLKDPKDGKTVIPDALTKDGSPVELKPNTSSGKAKGAAQLPKYERATGKKGRVVTYDPTKVTL